MIQKHGRAYEVGDRLIEVNTDVLDMLKKWNSHETKEEGDSRNDLTLDFPFALTVLMAILSPDDIKTGDRDREAMGFLEGKFKKMNLIKLIHFYYIYPFYLTFPIIFPIFL